MKILHVNKYFETVVGGVETVLKDIVFGLEKEGFENEVLACDLGKTRTENVRGVRVWYAHAIKVIMSVPISFTFFWLFYKRAKHADAIFIHHPFPPASLACLFFGRKKPLYIWYHSDIVRQRTIGFLIRPIVRACLQRATKIFVSSDHIVRLSPVLASVAEKCIVIPFGINAEAYRTTEDIEREVEIIRATYGTPLILAVGRLVHYKGFSFAIDAMRGLSAHLLIVGKGKLHESLQEQIKAAGLENNCTILPGASSLIPYYHAADIFVFPSMIRSETFGLVQLEAMASGTPVVNTDVHAGVSQVGINGKTGYTVPKEDSAALHTTLKTMLTDKAALLEMGKHAQARAMQDFKFDECIKKVSESIRFR